MLTLEERLALNHIQQTTMHEILEVVQAAKQDLQTKRVQAAIQDLETEREVLLEEQQARDEIEYASVRGISAPDF